MTTTPTNKPIPSEDPRDLKFNAGKIDEEVNGGADYYTDRFGVQRLTNTGRNNLFQDAQDDKESRFQQFLLSSGYQFLGDYEDGPFQFSDRNQYIRYDNQYYRLNAATDVGFTTTGTDATSFANDVTHFVLMDGDTLRQNLGSSETGLGASLSMTEQGITVQDALRYLTISATGLAATDEAIKNAAIAKCELLGMDLVINPGSYKFITPLVWNAKRYSIRGTGNTIIDFTGLPAGSYAITVKPEATSAGTIWNAAAHSLSGLIFKGAPGIHGIKISQEINFDSPQITVRDCLFNEFDDHVTFGDNEWCCSFERVKFRANTNGSSRFVVIDNAYNGCENQRFLGCNFNGSNSGMGIKHIAGSCELTFDGCSFDYCHQVLSSVGAGARGVWRFNDTHFEDDGTMRQFDISSGNATFYVDLNQCDWAYITKDESGNNRIPTSIGAFESTNQKSTLRLSGCKFPIYDEVSDRSKSYLWVINNSAVRILANGNVIEHSTNRYFNMFSFGLNKFLALTDANRNSPALVTNGQGSITYDTSDLPANRINDNTWCITGVISGNVMIPIDPSNREINLSGNLKRTSSEYYIDVRFFTALNVQLSAISLGVPGDIN
ncbi:TPA: hypothetical protein ACNB31_003616, partial [Escherichia coli]